MGDLVWYQGVLGRDHPSSHILDIAYIAMSLIQSTYIFIVIKIIVYLII